MGPGGPPGLQNRRCPRNSGQAEFDSQALPPAFARLSSLPRATAGTPLLAFVADASYGWHASRVAVITGYASSRFDITMKWHGRDVRSVSLNGRVPVSA